MVAVCPPRPRRRLEYVFGLPKTESAKFVPVRAVGCDWLDDDRDNTALVLPWLLLSDACVD